MAEEWSIPEEIVEAIGDHHAAAASPLSDAIARARALAVHLGFGDGIAPPEDAIDGSDLPVEEKLMLSAVGGIEAPTNQVEWFRGALAEAA